MGLVVNFVIVKLKILDNSRPSPSSLSRINISEFSGMTLSNLSLKFVGAQSTSICRGKAFRMK